MDHLTEHLVADGALHAIRLKQTNKTERKKKIAAATYLYQADCDGEWGGIVFDFENETAGFFGFFLRCRGGAPGVLPKQILIVRMILSARALLSRLHPCCSTLPNDHPFCFGEDPD